MEKLSPEKAVEMLKKKGVDISLEQAKLVLEFMRKMANIVVASYLDKARKEKAADTQRIRPLNTPAEL